MIKYFVFLILVSISRADWIEKCDKQDLVTVKLEPTKDNQTGRFLVEWCTKAKKDDIMKFKLWLKENVTEANCTDKNLDRAQQHSYFGDIIDSPLNCSTVCHWGQLAMVFTGCYVLKTEIGNRTKHEYRYITTADYSYFAKFRPNALNSSNSDNLTLTWYMGFIPVTSYQVELCNQSDYWWCRNVTGHCENLTSRPRHAIECAVPHLPYGEYQALLNLKEYWLQGTLFDHTFVYNFSHSSGESAGVSGVSVAGGAGVSLWATGCLCGALAVVGALVLWDARRAKRYSRVLLNFWRNWHGQGQLNPHTVGVTSAGPVLLLYARDCRAAHSVVTALAALLECVAPGQVYDLFSPSVKAVCALKPREWVRALVQREGARVVLLETPAAPALYAPLTITTGDVKNMSEPLLPGRAAYRVPDAQDYVLQYALDLVRTAAPADTPTQYTKYYIVRVDGLQDAEVLSHVSPLVRYSVPSTVRALLRDLAGGELDVSAELLCELERAAGALLEYVADNPNYIEELAVPHGAPEHN